MLNYDEYDATKRVKSVDGRDTYRGHVGDWRINYGQRPDLKPGQFIEVRDNGSEPELDSAAHNWRGSYQNDKFVAFYRVITPNTAPQATPAGMATTGDDVGCW